MKAYIGADAESGLMHHGHGTTHVTEVTDVAQLLQGAENIVCTVAGYAGRNHQCMKAAGDLADC